MLDFLTQLMPNVIDKWPAFVQACVESLQMIAFSGIISFVFGLIFGVTLTVTNKDGILENRIIWTILDKLVNIIRAIPFIILVALLMDMTRAIAGTTIGVRGAIFPLIMGTVPFFSRQIESALAEVDYGLIEASQSMGDSPFQTIIRVYLKESIPGIIRATTITLISLIGLTAMVGVVGGGGIGNFAIQYGYSRHQPDITYVSCIVILIFITLIQSISNVLIQKTTH